MRVRGTPLIRRMLVMATSAATLAAMLPGPAARSQNPAPAWSKAFTPGTIGPGSVSTLTFTIDNSAGAAPADDLAFSDTLPAGVTIADPANAATTCANSSGGLLLLDAPPGGSTIALSSAAVAAGRSCTVTVDVTSAIGGTHTNVSGTLTSSLGNSGTATADLVVDTALPGFSKSFSPDPIDKGERSTLTLLIDNTANDIPVTAMDFTDNLPAGLVIADPANAATTCGTPPQPIVLVADPDTSLISLSYFGSVPFPAVAAGGSCTVVVDVIGTAGGTFTNSSSSLSVTVSGQSGDAGKANADITVNIAPLHVEKDFVDDPTVPGGAVVLEFTVTNLDRVNAATSIALTDDLPGSAGLTVTGLPVSDVCGSGSQLTATADGLALSSGAVPAGGSCTFAVTLMVNAATAGGVYVNETSEVTGMVGGSPVTGNTAKETLFVVPAATLAKSFTDDPVGSGGIVTLEFTLTNTTASAVDGIAFNDEFSEVITGSPSGAPPDGFCGGSSTATFTPKTPAALASLSVSGASLAASGSPGDSCTFSLTLQVEEGAAGGIYPNETSAPTAIVGETTVTGKPAKDGLVVIGGPSLVKEFTDSTVAPGGQATLQFTLIHDEVAESDAAGIGFTDDLGSLGGGFTASGVPVPDLCGPGNGTLVGLTTLTVSGIALGPGEECVFTVTVDVAANASLGLRTNATSTVTATVGGVETVSPAATTNLTVTPLTLTKEFTNDPVVPGGQVTLQFSFTNAATTDDASNVFFTDDLDDVVTGLKSSAGQLPMVGCGGTLTGAAGDTFLTFSGGSVPAGTSCSFSVTLDVPAGTIDNTYSNTTRDELATIGNAPGVAFGSATDELVVESPLPPLLTKQFIDDPVRSGDPVTLQFTVENPNDVETLTGIGFTDDVSATLAGLTASPPPVPDPPCGPNSSLAGTSVLALSGGELGPGARCTFSVTLGVPGSARPGNYHNTTSNPQADVAGFGTVTGVPASDSLVVEQLKMVFTKSFADDPVPPGAQVRLQFTIDSSASTADASGLSFQDNLSDTLSGLVATGLPKSNICGAESQISGTSLLNFTGGDLPAGTSCTFSVTLAVPSSAVLGSYPNTTSTLRAAGLPVAPAAADTLVVETPQADLSIMKTDDPDPLVAGGSLTYTVTVTNNGPSDAAGVVATDTLPPEVTFVSTSGCAEDPNGVPSCSLGDIAAGASQQYTIQVTVDPGTPAGLITNTVEVSSDTFDPVTSGEANNNVAVERTRVDVQAGRMAIQKSTNGVDADTAPGPIITVGDAVTWTYRVTNTGDSTLSGIVVTDDREVAVSCPRTSLAPGASMTCTASGTAVVGQYRNVGTVTGRSPDNRVVTASDPSHYVGRRAAPAISIEKSTNGEDADEAPGPFIPVGSTVSWTYVVSNSGNVDLAGVTVVDDQGVTAFCGVDPPESGAGVTGQPFDLAVGESVTCTATDTAVAGQYRNVATATGTPPTGPDVSDDDPSHYFGAVAEPAVAIEKATNGQDADEAPGPMIPVGGAVSWTYEISNVGDAVLTDIAVTDDRGVAVSCPRTSLAVGASMVCTASGVAAAGIYRNVATVTATAPGGRSPSASDPSHYLGQVAGAAIDVEKSTNGEDADSPPGPFVPLGAPVTWTYVVANHGDVALTGVTVSDDRGVTPFCEGATPPEGGNGVTGQPFDLAVGQAVSCRASATAVAGQYANVATATGTPPSGPEVTASDRSHYIGAAVADTADLNVEKSAAATVLAGTAVEYAITITNAGPAVASNVLVTDTLPIGVSLMSTSGCAQDPTGVPTCSLGTIAPRASKAFTIRVRVDANRAPGALSNTVSVTSDAVDPRPIDNVARATTQVDREADLAVTKTAAPAPVVAGSNLIYTVVVTNNGPSQASGVVVTDTLPPGVTPVATAGCAEDPAGVPTCTLGTIGVGASKQYTITVAVGPATTGTLTNRAVVVGEVADPDPGNDAASAQTAVRAEADLVISKVGSPDPVELGGLLTYTVAVTNNGPSPAAGVVVTDTLPPGVTLVATAGCAEDPAGVPTCTLGTIPAGASRSYTATVRVAGNTVRPLTNRATVTALTPLVDIGNDSIGTTTAVAPPRQPEIGLFDPVTARWTQLLRDGTTRSFTYGDPGDVGIVGDWDGDPDRTPGVYRPSEATFYGRNSNSSGRADFTFPVGEPGDIPVAGDWNGDGRESIALFRPTIGRWYVFFDFADVVPDAVFFFGNPGDAPSAVDIDGDGDSDPVVYRDTGGMAGRVFSRRSLATGVADVIFTYGDPSDRILFGDYDYDGDSTVGVYRPATATFYLRNANTTGVGDLVIALGAGRELPNTGPYG